MYLDGQGRAGRPPTAALILHRQATDLLQDGILPSARGLTGQNAAVLDQAYQAKRSAARFGVLWVTLAGLALIAVLVSLQLYLALRYRRMLNPALAAATVVAAALVAASAAGLSVQARYLYVAKSEAFDSIVALSQARAVSDDANADESRYLVDPAGAVDEYRADHADVRFGVEFRNITFPASGPRPSRPSPRTRRTSGTTGTSGP
jgi:hypothetical protein